MGVLPVACSPEMGSDHGPATTRHVNSKSPRLQRLRVQRSLSPRVSNLPCASHWIHRLTAFPPSHQFRHGRHTCSFSWIHPFGGMQQFLTLSPCRRIEVMRFLPTWFSWYRNTLHGTGGGFSRWMFSDVSAATCPESIFHHGIQLESAMKIKPTERSTREANCVCWACRIRCLSDRSSLSSSLTSSHLTTVVAHRLPDQHEIQGREYFSTFAGERWSWHVCVTSSPSYGNTEGGVGDPRNNDRTWTAERNILRACSAPWIVYTDRPATATLGFECATRRWNVDFDLDYPKNLANQELHQEPKGISPSPTTAAAAVVPDSAPPDHLSYEYCNTRRRDGEGFVSGVVNMLMMEVAPPSCISSPAACVIDTPREQPQQIQPGKTSLHTSCNVGNTIVSRIDAHETMKQGVNAQELHRTRPKCEKDCE